MDKHQAPNRNRRHRDERGAAMLEFSIVAILIIALLLAIVSFGMLLSVRNSITQSANEGARAAVGVFGVSHQNPTGPVIAAAKIHAEDTALQRMRERLSHLEKDVGGDVQLQCSVPAQCPFVTSDPSIIYLARVHDCNKKDESDLEDFNNSVDTASVPDCIFTRVTYRHAEHPLLPAVPLFSAALPDKIVDRADVAL